MTTSEGEIVLELDVAKAPVSVENFSGYTESGFYDGTIFHRVMSHFMIQGGGFTPDLTKKETGPPIVNEWQNGLKNKRGTIAMARLPDPNSATSQFFINVVDNDSLDQPVSGGAGYAVFGKVVAGMDVVDAIKAVPTGMKRSYQDVPVEDVVIKSVRQLTPEEAQQRTG
jgi:cyclophilin family peptidyl-prolyl cis-trans isomerase